MSLKGSFDGFIGIDVSKDKFDTCGITGDEVKLFQFSTTMDRKGFEKLKGHLTAVSISAVLIGMESNLRRPIMSISSLTLFLRVTGSFSSTPC